MADVLRDDSSLTAVEYGGIYFGHGAENQARAVDVKRILEWWEEIRDRIQ